MTLYSFRWEAHGIEVFCFNCFLKKSENNDKR